MSSKTWHAIKDSNYIEQINQFASLIEEADAIVVGTGAGMSSASGFTYIGDRFTDNFPDFIEKYDLLDMLQASLFDYESLEEYWAFQSRFVIMNFYDQTPGVTYTDLAEILKDKNYFIISTNADNRYRLADFDMDKVFQIQGQYGLWQCSEHCHQQTYSDEATIRKMAAEQKDMKAPTQLIPYCPKCEAPLEVNKRTAEKGMVEDDDFHKHEKDYHDFLDRHQGEKVLFIEIGVGHTTPQYIKEPFQKMTAENENAQYITMNQKHYRIPPAIRARTSRVDSDIKETIQAVKEKLIQI